MTTTARSTSASHPYRVRKIVSGYTGYDSYLVFLLRPGQPASRVSVHAFHSRESAQVAADDLNIMDMVKPHAEDPRPFAERLAEAKAAYQPFTA